MTPGAQFAQRRVAQRAFVGPARAALAEKCFDKALRLMAAGALISDDLEFQLDAETAGPNRFALWRAALQAVQYMPHLVLSGKEDSFAAIAFSPDSTHVVIGGGDRTARILEVASGTEVAVLRGHTDRVDCVAFSPDGSRVLTGSGGYFGSGDGTARLWDATTGAEQAVLRGHEKGVLSAAFSTDGKLVLTGSDDGTARIWDSKTGTVLRVLSGHERGVCAAVFSPDGNLVITGAKDNMACIWEVAIGVLAATLSGHREDVCCVAISPDGRLALTGDQGGTVHIWELPGGAGISSFRIPTWGAMRAAFSADAARILICLPDGTVRLLELPTGEEIARSRQEPPEKGTLVVNSNWTYGISTRSDNGSSSATLWDLAVSAKMSRISAKPLGDYPSVRALDADNLRAITLNEDKSVQIWDLHSGTSSVSLCGDPSQTTTAAFDAAGGRIATGAQDGTVRIWNAWTGENLHTLIGHKKTVGKASFSSDGTHLISTAPAEAARVWDLASGREIAALPTSGGKKRDPNAMQWSLSAALSKQGKRAVIGSDDATVQVWDVETGEEMLLLRITTKSYSGFIRSPVSVAINPAGTRIITDASWCMPGCGDSSLTQLWDVTTGEELIEFPTYVNQFRYCAFSHGGEVAATGSTDGKVQLWDIGAGALIAELSDGGDDRNEKLCFSSDDSRLAVYSSGRPGKAGDGAVYVWDVSRWTAYDGDRAVLLAAALGSGLGQRTEAERSDLLLQDAPDDLHAAMMQRLSAQQRARVPEVSRRLRAPLHPNCYLTHFGEAAHGES